MEPDQQGADRVGLKKRIAFDYELQFHLIAMAELPLQSGALSFITLDRLPLSSWGRIKEIDGEPTAVTRLHALGLLPGQLVQQRHRALLGEPIAFEVAGQKIALRNQEARMVLVERIVPSGHQSGDPS